MSLTNRNQMQGASNRSQNYCQCICMCALLAYRGGAIATINPFDTF